MFADQPPPVRLALVDVKLIVSRPGFQQVGQMAYALLHRNHLIVTIRGSVKHHHPQTVQIPFGQILEVVGLPVLPVDRVSVNLVQESRKNWDRRGSEPFSNADGSSPSSTIGELAATAE